MSYTEDFNLMKAGSTRTLMLIDEVLEEFEGLDKKQKETLKLTIDNKVKDFYNMNSNIENPQYYSVYSSEILKLYNRKTRNRNNYQSRI